MEPVGCSQYGALLSFALGSVCLACSPNGCPAGCTLAKVLRLSFSSAPLQASLMALAIQDTHMDFTSCTLDLGAHVVTLGEWWMWGWGTLRMSCKTMNIMKSYKPASHATVTTLGN